MLLLSSEILEGVSCKVLRVKAGQPLHLQATLGEASAGRAGAIAASRGKNLRLWCASVGALSSSNWERASRTCSVGKYSSLLYE